MTKNKLTPLQILRQEKEIAKRECTESEARLAGHWSYLSENATSLVFQSAIDAVLHKFGFGHRSRSGEDSSSEGGQRGLLSGLAAYYPMIWEIAQPLLLRFAMKKIKSLFSRKKKKKSNDD